MDKKERKESLLDKDKSKDYDFDDAETEDAKRREELFEEYQDFLEENSTFWKAFNTAVLLISAGFGVGCYYITSTHIETDLNIACSPLKAVLFFVMIMHGVNVCMSLVNLIGVETMLCFQNGVLCLGVYEIGMLVFMQIAYFNSQDDNCLYNAPNLYFFLMGQILTLYLGGAVVLCYFVRKVC